MNTKVFLFVRGPISLLKEQTIDALCDGMIPGTWVRVDIDLCDPMDRKNGHVQSKKIIQHAIHHEHPRVFMITNPSLNSPDWDSYLALATPQTVSIGIDVYSENVSNSNLQLRNVREFIVSTYKYLCVKLSDDIPGIVQEVVRVTNRN